MFTPPWPEVRPQHGTASASPSSTRPGLPLTHARLLCTTLRPPRTRRSGGELRVLLRGPVGTNPLGARAVRAEARRSPEPVSYQATADAPSPRQWRAWFRSSQTPARPKDCRAPGSCSQLSGRQNQCDVAATRRDHTPRRPWSSG